MSLADRIVPLLHIVVGGLHATVTLNCPFHSIWSGYEASHRQHMGQSAEPEAFGGTVTESSKYGPKLLGAMGFDFGELTSPLTSSVAKAVRQMQAEPITRIASANNVVGSLMAADLAHLMNPMTTQLEAIFGSYSAATAFENALAFTTDSTSSLISTALAVEVPAIPLGWLAQLGETVVDFGAQDELDSIVGEDDVLAAAVRGVEGDASLTTISPELASYGAGFLVWAAHLTYVVWMTGDQELARTLAAWIKEGLVDGLFYAASAKVAVSHTLKCNTNAIGG